MATPTYKTFLPAAVRYDNTLPFGARILYSEIVTLASKEGSCWASNAYFARLFNTSTRNISRWIAALIKRNYIQMELLYKKGTLEIAKRTIYVNKAYFQNDYNGSEDYNYNAQKTDDKNYEEPSKEEPSKEEILHEVEAFKQILKLGKLSRDEIAV